MSELQKLLERVENATGPDREIDEAIMALVYVRDERHIGAYMENDLGRDEPVKDRVWVDPKTDKWVSTHAYAYTASIDDALALVERVLPGQQWTLGRNLHHHYWLCTFNRLDDEGAPYSNASSHAAPTPPLAILAAILKALIS